MLLVDAAASLLPDHCCEGQQHGDVVLQGGEVFNNYGSTKPNEELLLGYGFVL
jgi:hypothetical protein